MAKNISLLGADYPQVPAVQLPQTGGGTATFYDIEVIDNLDSESSTDALSAKQGKVLNDKIKGNIISEGTVNLDTLIIATGEPQKIYSISAIRYTTNYPTGLNGNFPALLKINSFGGYGCQELFVYTADGSPDRWYRQQFYMDASNPKKWGTWTKL